MSHTDSASTLVTTSSGTSPQADVLVNLVVATVIGATGGAIFGPMAAMTVDMLCALVVGDRPPCSLFCVIIGAAMVSVGARNLAKPGSWSKPLRLLIRVLAMPAIVIFPLAILYPFLKIGGAILYLLLYFLR
jgi:hypothetical protein